MAQVPAQRSQGSKMTSPRHMERMRRDFDTLFTRMFSDWLSPRLFSDWLTPADRDFGWMQIPNVDITENDNEIVVRAELPGFEDSEIDVQLADNILTIRAEKEQHGERESDFRRFYETVALPNGIDSTGVKATHRQGVLELHIPRTEEAKPRKIQVHGQDGGGGHQSTTGHGTTAGGGSQASGQTTEATKTARGSNR